MKKSLVYKNSFTLMEIVIALAITAVVLTSGLEMLGTSKKRVMEAERIWANEHLLSLAAEHYLVYGPEMALSSDLLPRGFSVKCALTISPFQRQQANKRSVDLEGWVLGIYKISLYDTKGSLIDSLEIETVLQKKDIP